MAHQLVSGNCELRNAFDMHHQHHAWSHICDLLRVSVGVLHAVAETQTDTCSQAPSTGDDNEVLQATIYAAVWCMLAY